MPQVTLPQGSVRLGQVLGERHASGIEARWVDFEVQQRLARDRVLDWTGYFISLTAGAIKRAEIPR